MIDSKSPDNALVFEADGRPVLAVRRLPDGDVLLSTFWGETRIIPERAA